MRGRIGGDWRKEIFQRGWNSGFGEGRKFCNLKILKKVIIFLHNANLLLKKYKVKRKVAYWRLSF